MTLGRLLTLNGYDSFGEVAENDWLSYVGRLMEQFAVQPHDSVFEVGCGAGAFLYPWRQRGHRVAGIDLSENLIAAARTAMPDGDFQVGDAKAIDVDERYDIVVSHGVFPYFPDHDYAAGVLRGMVAKARRVVSVLEIPDLAKKDQALASRREKLGEDEYRRRYAGLGHLFFRQDWFEEILAGMGLQLSVREGDLRGYFHAKYRFQVVIRKTGQP